MGVATDRRLPPRLMTLAGRPPRGAAAVAVYRDLPRELLSRGALDGPEQARVLTCGTELGRRDARMVLTESGGGDGNPARRRYFPMTAPERSCRCWI